VRLLRSLRVWDVRERLFRKFGYVCLHATMFGLRVGACKQKVQPAGQSAAALASYLDTRGMR